MTWDKMKMSSDKLTKIFSYCYHMSWTDLSVKMDTPSLLVQNEERLSVVRYEYRLAL